MKILYCGNQGVIDGIMSSLISIANKTTEPIKCYILTMDLSDIDARYQPISTDFISFLQEVVQQKNLKHQIIRIDVTALYNQELRGNCNEHSFYTPYCLLRLLSDLVIFDEKILYLDVDVMAGQNILPLYETDLQDYEYAGVKDFYGSFFLHKNYVNSGVLLLNMKRINETGLFRKARKMVREKKLSFPDQDALYHSTKQCMFLPRIYNEQFYFNKKDTVLCHFSRRFWLLPYPHRENYKQWHIREIHRYLHCHAFDDDLQEYLELKRQMDDQSRNQHDSVIVKLEHVNKFYDIGDIKIKALHDINLEIKKGELMVILGSSGSGKSTLLNLIGGLDKPTSGSIYFHGQNISHFSKKEMARYRKDDIGFVFQFYNLIQDLTAYENVELSAGITEQSMSIDEALAIVGLDDKKDRYPFQMSGGEQQRISIARSIVKQSEIMLCDEPTGALDHLTGLQVLDIIESLRQKYHRTILIVTHNPDIAQIADRVVKMQSGKIVSIECHTNPLKVRDLK